MPLIHSGNTERRLILKGGKVGVEVWMCQISAAPEFSNTKQANGLRSVKED